ncbi:MAG: DUF4190 domain-containing protein [Planctomycetes bacterium]|nr:DUF4190 domain-containing protein [Planctomycetota bacterium]
MSRYYIDTASGPRGPYPAQQIIEGVKQGRIPTNATLRDADTGATLRAVDVAAQAAPSDSGGYAPVQQHSGPSPQFMPRQQHYQQPQQYPQQYQQQPQYQQQYGQPQFPQPRYPQGPYPQSGAAYPGQYPQQYGQYPAQNTYQPYGSSQLPPQYGAGETSTLATASLICSLVSIVVCTPLCIVGIVLGIMALNECQPNGPKRGRGLALGGIWTGVGILVMMVGVIALMVALD